MSNEEKMTDAFFNDADVLSNQLVMLFIQDGFRLIRPIRADGDQSVLQFPTIIEPTTA